MVSIARRLDKGLLLIYIFKATPQICQQASLDVLLLLMEHGRHISPSLYLRYVV